MNNVLDRIAELRMRFEPTRPVSFAPTATDFSSLLASAQTSHAAKGGSNPIETLGASTGTDASALAAMSRLLVGNASAGATAAVAKARYQPTSQVVPAGFADYSATISQMANEEGVPASLLGALVWSESGFNPDAVSSAGARGLAQLMPATATALGVDIDDPTDNLRGGARYLRQMLDRFASTDLALAAYNAGPGAVTRAGGIPAYQETQNYVTRVMARAATLSRGQV